MNMAQSAMLLTGSLGTELPTPDETGTDPSPYGTQRPAASEALGRALILADAAALRKLGHRDRRRLRRWLTALKLVLVESEPTSLDPGDDLWREFPEDLRVAWSELPDSLREVLGLGPEVAGEGSRTLRFERPRDELRDQHERLVNELRMAEQVQRSMLPRALPNLPGVILGAALRACQHLAGDFYNAFRLDRDRIGFYVGDVMGHGPAAALLSVYAMRVIQSKRIEGNQYEILSPSESLAALNLDLIAGDFPGEPFVTMVYGVLDVPRRHLRYCCAGHPPALLLRPGEAPMELGGGGPLLGVIDHAAFETHEVGLQGGDRLVLYSDGLDAAHWERHGRGLKALADRLAERDDRSPQQLVDDSMNSARLDDWRADDLTMLMAEITD